MPKSFAENVSWNHRSFSRILAIGILLSLLPLSGETLPPPVSAAPPFPEPTQLEIKDELGKGVQRFMKRVEESTPQHKNTVRVLYYGQSITEQEWTKLLSADLRRRYPNVNFIIENRAIGGFSSERLVNTSEADLYPFYADLVIFYDFGRADRYEDMVRRMRERTTSEILLQTDHLNKMENLTEETDPGKLSPGNWGSWFPNSFIPTMACKYQTGMVQQRALWKIYCQQNNIDPRNLTVDGAHLNDQGNFLMAKIVGAYLTRRPQYDDAGVEKQIRDVPYQDLKWTGNKLVFPFTGNKIDVIAEAGAKGTADVLIDGKKPSELPEVYKTSRVSGYPGIGWPIISRSDHQSPLVLEDWTATATDFSQDGKHFKFSVSGSVTGPDGEGTSDATFVSKSGRVVIDPKYWNMAYSFGLMQGEWAKEKNKPPFVVPSQIVATWKVIPFFTDTYSTPAIPDPAVETPVILAQGVSNGPHELQLIGHDGLVKFKALRVYQPPLATSEPSQDAPISTLQNVPTFAAPIQKTGEVKTQ